MFKSLLFVSLIISAQSWAENQDDAELTGAIQETQRLMENKSERQKVILKDSKAKAADDQVKAVSAGDAQTEDEIYAIAGELLPYIQKLSNNDLNQMAKLVEEAQKDPKKFAEHWPPEQRAKLKAIAEKIQRQNEKKKGSK